MKYTSCFYLMKNLKVKHLYLLGLAESGGEFLLARSVECFVESTERGGILQSLRVSIMAA